MHKGSPGETIRLFSEVEKIWIMFNKGPNENLTYADAKTYLQNHTFKELNLTDLEARQVIATIDKERSRIISKQMMKEFLTKKDLYV